MLLSELYQPGRLTVSFELFPPKTPAGDKALLGHLDKLVELEPGYITCTYGAGGSTREKTLQVVSTVRQRYGLPVATHLTCVGSTVDQLRDYLRQTGQLGIENVVALRGDPPKGESSFRAVAGGLRYANELVALIRREFERYGVAVAGYPEKHLEAPDADTDLANLKRKVDAGADVVITQLFYDNADFFRFRERCQDVGITVPIVPGILPVTNLAQIQRITSLCGARLPEQFVADLTAAGDDEAAQFRAGVEFAASQVQQLVDAGVPGVHFYVLNKSPATCEVLRQIERPA